MENRIIDYRPIGYTKFLQLIHFISRSHVFLVIVQHILLQASLLYLLFTVKYLLQPGKWAFRILFLCCLLNPIMPHVSNFVSSDPLFTALSLLWLTQLLWITVKPSLRLLLFHAVILSLTFTVRYNALYYPAISILIIIFTQVTAKVKSIGITFVLLLLGSFLGFNRNQFKKQTGVAQFAPFSGWQTVANALETYYHAPQDAPKSVPIEFKALHTRVNHYMDSLRSTRHNPAIESASYYMWGDKSPILKYLGSNLRINNNLHPDFKLWASIAPFYSKYGNYLIKRHLSVYIKHYLADNLNAYNKPSPEYLGIYNSGLNTIEPAAVKWFGLKTNKIITNQNSTQISSTQVISFVNGAFNLLLILSVACFLGMGSLQKISKHSKRVICWLILIWISNLGFSILASHISLRYLTFQITITLLLEMLFLEFIVREYKTLSATRKKQPTKRRYLPN